MRFRLLGSVQVWDEDRQLAIGGPQQRALLALLLLSANRVVPVEQLVAALWEDRPPADARALVQSCVARLRRVLSSVDGKAGSLVTQRPGYVLRVEPDELDLDRFDALTATARQLAEENTAESLRRASSLLAEALALWQGPALSDVGLATCAAAVAGIEERRLAALEERIDIDVRLGRHRDVIGELRQHVAAYPLRERPRALLMLALYRDGRQAEALAAYADARRTLVDELGVEPGPELRRSHQAILANGDEAAVVDAAPPAAVPTPKPRQLPPPVRHFAGRAAELARLTDLLDETTVEGGTVVISTISGIAGVGKTALAVHYGHQVADRFPDGHLYVDLRGFDAAGAPVGPAEAIRVFLDALDVPPQRVPADLAAQTALYRSLLAGRRMLVILDNARDSAHVRPLLPGSPGCLAIVTSRNQLSSLVTAEGAHVVTLGALSGAEAHELITRRVGAGRVAAEPDAVAEIVQRCAGLPLALSLVASRATLRAAFPLAVLADELRRTAGSLDAFTDPEPATDVRAVFAWSYRTLHPATARVFRLMGLHPGADVPAGAVAALAGRPADETRAALAELTNANLVTEHLPDRFTLHDLLRVYAAEQTRAVDAEPDRRAATGRLLAWYWYTADAATQLLYPEVTRLPGPRVDRPPGAPELAGCAAALAWLDAERGNLRAVGDLAARAGPRALAWLIADALRLHLRTQMYTADWLALAETGLAAAEAENDLTAQAATHLSLGEAAAHVAHYARSTDHHAKASQLARRAGWAKGEVQALTSLANSLVFQGRLGEAIEVATRAETRARRAGDLFGQARGVVSRGLALLSQGRLRDAADHVARAGAMFRRCRSGGFEGMILLNLGEIYHCLGQLDDATEHLNRALDNARERGHRRAEPEAMRLLAAVYQDLGDHRRATELADAALGRARDAGPRFETGALNVHGFVAQRSGRHRSARDSHERALALSRRAGQLYQLAETLTLLAAAHHGLGELDRARRYADEALAICRGAGCRMVEGQALAALAAVELGEGHRRRAADLARQAVAIQRETGHRPGEARALTLLGQAVRHSDPRAAEALLRQAYDLFLAVAPVEADDVRDLLDDRSKC